MRVLLVAHDFAQAGAQYSLLRLLRQLRKTTTWQFAVLALNGGPLLPEYEELAPVKMVFRSELLPQYLDPLNVSAMEIALQELSRLMGGMPSCILGNTVVSSLAYPHLKKINIPIITRIAELEASMARYASAEMVQALLTFSDEFIAVSRPVNDNLQRLGVAPERITCIHGAIEDYPTAPELERRQSLASSLRIQASQSILWGCGYLSKCKGTDLYYEACLHLYDMGVRNFHAIWVGNLDSSFTAWAEAPKPRHPAQHHISFIGAQKAPYLLMQPQDIFVLSSREDSFPLVALEAAERGLPLIGFSDSGGMVEVIQQGAGILAAKENAESLALCMRQLLDNPQRATELGQKAKEIVLAKYTVEHSGIELQKLISRVVQGRQQ